MTLTSIITPLDRVNVDTDQIVPKQFLKLVQRTGFGKFLFYDWRFDKDQNPKDDFVLNDPKFKGHVRRSRRGPPQRRIDRYGRESVQLRLHCDKGP